jgi:hypothetical protein
MWWGGSSAPARFLVPVVPLFAPALALMFARLRGGLLAAHVWLALGFSVCVAALSLTNVAPALLFSSPHGVAHLAELLRGGSPLPSALPTFTEENWLAPIGRLALWGGAVVATAVCGWLWSRRQERLSKMSPTVLSSPSLFWPLFVEASVFLVAASLVVGPYAADARAEAVRHGRFGLLTAFDPDARRAFDYRAGALAKMTPAQWTDATSLTFRLDPAEAPDPQGRLTEGLSLPPGEYTVSVTFDDGGARTGDVLAALGGGNVLARVSAQPRLASMQVFMPIAVPQLWVQMSDAPSAAAARRVDVTPLTIVPVQRRERVEVRRVEAVEGRPHAYVAYVNDGAFPEGGVFWTRGTTQADVLVAPAGASIVNLTIHAGPEGGEVRVSTDGKPTSVTLQGGETRTMSIPVSPDTRVLALSVQSSSAFRPSDVDRTSTDTRELGCQVRIDVGPATP